MGVFIGDYEFIDFMRLFRCNCIVGDILRKRCDDYSVI